MTITIEIPIRVQRSRKRGWRMPPNTVYVGRPTIFGNPFVDHVGRERYVKEGDVTIDLKARAVNRYRDWLEGHREHGRNPIKPSPSMIAELRGKNLCCWCKPGDPCHADVLLEIANA